MTATSDVATKTASSQGLLVPMLILAGAACRVLSFFFSDNCGGDASERLGLTARWLTHPSLKLIFFPYLPGHFWLMGGLATIIPNVVVASRLTSLLLGFGSLFLLWKLSSILFDRRAAALSLAVFAFYSLQIGYSTTSSSEVPEVFFVLLALCFFFSYFQGEQPRSHWLLALAGLSLSGAESIRFEPWIVFAGLLLVFPFLSRSTASARLNSKALPAVVFGLSAGMLPALIMWYCWRRFGNPLYLISDTRARMTHVLAVSEHSRAYELGLIPGVLFISLSPVAIAGVIYAITRLRRSRLAAAFAVVTTLLLLIQELQIARGGFLAVARYSLTVGALLCVLSGDGLEAICERLLPERVNWARMVVVLLLFLNLLTVWAVSDVHNRLSDRFGSISPRLRYKTQIAEVARYLRARLTPKDAVVIDDYNVESNIIADAAGLPVQVGNRAYLLGLRQNISAMDYIRAQRPRFLVYSDRGELRRDFLLPQDCSQKAIVDNIEFDCRVANNLYRVYELRYPQDFQEMRPPHSGSKINE